MAPSSTNTYGIIEFYETSSSPRLNIVFVHGLTGKGEATWSQKGADPWPKALLPASLKKAQINANIYAFAYDADIVNFGSTAGQNRITEHARNVIGQINKKQVLDSLGNVPIIFVAHSLGGLVVKDALAIANRSKDDPLRKIVDLTIGIIFMGTPHCGADAARFAKFMGRLTGAFRPTATGLLNVLKRDSEILKIVTTDFHDMLGYRRQEHKPELEITCFCEELPMQLGPVTHTIVDLDSATIPGYQTYTIHANHETMTKFSDAKDSGYTDVLTQIIQMANTRLNARPAGEAARDARAEAAQERATSTRGGPFNVGQGSNSISNVTANSGGGSMNFGNQNHTTL